MAYGLAKPVAAWLFSGFSVTVQENIAMLAGMCIFVGMNYLGQRFVVFREAENDKDRLMKSAVKDFLIKS